MSKALKHRGTEIPKSPKPASYSGTQQSGAKKKPANSSMFNKQNYLIMLIGLIVLGIGFFLMAGGKSSNPNVFNTSEVYSFNRITLAPLLIIVGFLIEIYAIMKKPARQSGE